MGTDTNGIVTGKVGIADIVNAVRVVLDPSATSDFTMRSGTTANDFMGYVYFKYNEKPYSVFVCKVKDNAEDTEYHGELHTALSIGCNGESVEIMRKLIGYFGGYVDDSDCDDIGFYKVDQDGTARQPILEVTWEEVYEKFGRVVKIKDD